MKKSLKYIGILAVAVLMQSCFSAKTYERPSVKTDNLYRLATPSADTTSLADLSWNQLFTDPILQRYINAGLQNNYDIRIALQNIAAAEANYKQGKAGYFPTLNLGADWTHQELSKNSQFGALVRDRSVDQYQFTGNLSWEADIWGKIRSNKRSAHAAYLQSVSAKQAVQTRLVSDIASVYFQLMTLDAQLKVTDSTLVNRSKSIEAITALKEAGASNEVGVKLKRNSTLRSSLLQI
jgi:multidrug efflux system outer membrane protein